jgi:hypothetical protein
MVGWEEGRWGVAFHISDRRTLLRYQSSQVVDCVCVVFLLPVMEKKSQLAVLVAAKLALVLCKAVPARGAAENGEQQGNDEVKNLLVDGVVE